MVLEKYDVTTRDPNLYYIAMEKSSSNRRGRKATLIQKKLVINFLKRIFSETRSQTVVLDDEACPLVLQTNSLECAFKYRFFFALHKNRVKDIKRFRFHLRARDGRLVKVHGSDISPGVSTTRAPFTVS